MMVVFPEDESPCNILKIKITRTTQMPSFLMISKLFSTLHTRRMISRLPELSCLFVIPAGILYV
jgi:hypothetical protein